MGEVALYSSAPYEMSYAISPTRKMFSKQKMTAWQTSEQVFLSFQLTICRYICHNLSSKSRNSKRLDLLELERLGVL